MEIQIHINYHPESRGVRVALAYLKRENDLVGFILGYCGGGIQGEYYFQISKDFKDVKVFMEENHYWEETLTSDDIFDLRECRHKITDFLYLDESSLFFYIDSTTLATFERSVDEDGEERYFFQTEGFNENILSVLANKWAFITHYF